jgi:hypothetical protein
MQILECERKQEPGSRETEQETSLQSGPQQPACGEARSEEPVVFALKQLYSIGSPSPRELS